jgi:glycosyltransferase involved in cell wall biosynthesis
MRVAIVTPRFPPDAGGVEEYAAWVAETLRRSGAEVTVITTGRSRRATRETFHGIAVIRLGTWLTLSNTPVNPLWWWQLRRLLRDLDVDVVNAHAPVPGLADVAAFTSPVPVVLTYHAGSLVKGDSVVDPLLRAYERRVLPRVFARCRELVAVSPISLAHETGRAHLIPPGVDTDLFTPTGSDSSTQPRERRVLYVGRVERTSRWKGLHVLVDSLARLREQVPDVRLEIVGDGDDVEPLQKRAADLGVGDLIDWRGRVDHDALPAYYRRAGVTVLPSLTESESFGMALAEALACGCPVVGSGVGGIPYVVRDGEDGRLVPPGDPDALADALAGVLNEPPRPGQSRWDWKHQEDQTLRVITEVST